MPISDWSSDVSSSDLANLPLGGLGAIPVLGPVLSNLGLTAGSVLLDPNPHREFKIGVSVPNPNEPVTSQETFVEVLQLPGTSFHSALDWTAGAHYDKSRPAGRQGVVAGKRVCGRAK